jgi:hypothetical protein
MVARTVSNFSHFSLRVLLPVARIHSKEPDKAGPTRNLGVLRTCEKLRVMHSERASGRSAEQSNCRGPMPMCYGAGAGTQVRTASPCGTGGVRS